MLVRRRHFRAAHGERRPPRLDRAEALTRLLELAQRVEVDLDVEHALHAPDVRVTPGLVGVHEGARATDAGAGVDNPVAVHLAPTTLELLLRSQRDVDLRLGGPGDVCHVVNRGSPRPIGARLDRRDRREYARVGFAIPVRRVLFLGLLLAPIVVVVHHVAQPSETVEFVLAACALIPLAWLIGEATEHAAEHTGPGIGGFLNATFGNAPELIIALIAVNEGLTEVVRGSLTGSVVGNLLLVLGFSVVAGPAGSLDRWSSFMSFGAIGLAILLFLIPAIPSWSGDPNRSEIVDLSVPVSIALLVVYVGATWYSLRRHRAMHIADDEAIEGWSFRLSLGALAVATVATALVAEILVGTLEVFSHQVGLSEFFVAAVIVAIVGNAAEHGGAVVVAYRGKIRLAAEIALSSAAQVAVFLIPAVVLLSWLIEPLSLGFRPVEIGALGFALAVTAMALFNGRATKARGFVLLAAYVLVAVAFYVAGDREVATEGAHGTALAHLEG